MKHMLIERLMLLQQKGKETVVVLCNFVMENM